MTKATINLQAATGSGPANETTASTDWLLLSKIQSVRTQAKKLSSVLNDNLLGNTVVTADWPGLELS